MKKQLILLFIVLGTVVVTNAQNYLGLTEKQIKVNLDNKKVDYETYYTVSGDLGIRYWEEDGDFRTYTISAETGKCCLYVVCSNSNDFVFNSKKYLANTLNLIGKQDENDDWEYKRSGNTITGVILKIINLDNPNDYIKDYTYCLIIQDSRFN
jgi:hypothetical protein